jgi:hypothetical protein
MMTEEKGEAVEKESLHHRAERHAIYIVIDAVFGLSLGLGAFSLTELPIAEPQDLFLTIGFFGFSYFVIFMSWMSIRMYFEDYVVYGGINTILFFTGFFIAIMPIPIRIILMQIIEPTSPSILEAAFTLYPICLAAVTLTMGILSFAFSKQSWKTIPWKDFVHLLTEGVGAFVMGIIFLVSAFIPYENQIKDMLDPGIIQILPPPIPDLSFKIGLWFSGGIILALPALIISKIIIEHKRLSMQAKVS